MGENFGAILIIMGSLVVLTSAMFLINMFSIDISSLFTGLK